MTMLFPAATNVFIVIVLSSANVFFHNAVFRIDELKLAKTNYIKMSLYSDSAVVRTD